MSDSESSISNNSGRPLKRSKKSRNKITHFLAQTYQMVMVS